ncbi:MAG: hypothetical protein KH828_09110 [Clostridiales bacterium]|nr:hypothetical protein [Clostridiales bacterium]
MGYQELLIKAINYDYPEEIPVSCSFLPAAWLKYGEELVRLAKDYPDLIKYIPDLNHLEESFPETYHLGEHVDEWGCVWSNVDDGMESIVTRHPVPRQEDIFTLEIPKNRDGRMPHGFMYLRLLDLRGFEEAMVDFAEEGEAIETLIAKVLHYNLIQGRVILERLKPGEVAYFGDDLGMQTGLAIGAEKWRKYMKPCYTQIYKMFREKGCYVYMHTDGCIHEIMPDLVEAGVQMINPQFRANGIDNLERVCKGKIPINLDLDRQLFPFATPAQIKEHVRECVERLYLPQGGLGLNIELNYETPLENMAAVFDAVRQYRKYKG